MGSGQTCATSFGVSWRREDTYPSLAKAHSLTESEPSLQRPTSAPSTRYGSTGTHLSSNPYNQDFQAATTHEDITVYWQGRVRALNLFQAKQRQLGTHLIFPKDQHPRPGMNQKP